MMHTLQLPPETQSRLVEVLPYDLAKLAHEYLMPDGYDAIALGRSGHWELIMIFDSVLPWNKILRGSCRAGHVHVAKLALQKGATEIAEGLVNACKSRDRETITMIVGKIDPQCDDFICENCHKTIRSHRTP
jgi:hypothetical protein